MADIDYYEILDVEPTASVQEIKAAYYRAVRNAHPDAGGTAGMFRLVSQAYRTLADPQARAAYDARSGVAGTSETAGTGTGSKMYPPPEPEWGEEVSWEANHQEPMSSDLPRHGTTSKDDARGGVFDKLDAWLATRNGRLAIRGARVAAVVTFMLLSYILFAHPSWVRPEAAGSDLLGGLFGNISVLRIIVVIYAVLALGGLLGLLWIPAFVVHVVVLVALFVWPFAYWDIADGGERLAFLGVALLWFAYFLAMTFVPLLGTPRLNSDVPR